VDNLPEPELELPPEDVPGAAASATPVPPGQPATGGNGSKVIAAIPRRRQISSPSNRTSALSLPAHETYQPSLFAVMRRLVFWTYHVGGFLLRIKMASWRRRSNLKREAGLLRQMLEQMGPTAIKVGQQLSVRADLLPVQYCDELSKMLDKVPPFDFALAKPAIEKAIGRPLAEIFERVDHVPIGSASVSCVYQAKLLNGELVAVKVKRPGIAMALFTDLKTISLMCQAAEVLGFIRSGLTRNFRIELGRMLTEELNFRLEARYTEIFGRIAERHKYISAPKVYPHLSDNEVLVTEFISGVFLNEILNALERNDPVDIHRLRARGFSPKKISKRMMNIFHWEIFESLFFHADPHPANIIVRTDNTIVMIDFGSCGSISNRIKRKLLTFNRLMAAEDLQGMVQNTIAMLEPLPHFDVDSFSIDLLNIYREIFIALKSKYSPWYDKCSGAMWMKVIALGRKYDVPMTLDTVRIFRASFMYDSIIYRLNPQLDPIKEFLKWSDSWNKKNRRRMERSLAARVLGPLDGDFTRLGEVNGIFEHMLDRLSNMLDRPSYNFAFTIGKFAYVCTVFLKTSVVGVALTLIMSLARMFTAGPVDGMPSGLELARSVEWTLNNKYFIAGFTLYLLIAVRKVLFRIQDVDIDR
jgi:ubiquinone biosynthesis protein